MAWPQPAALRGAALLLLGLAGPARAVRPMAERESLQVGLPEVMPIPEGVSDEALAKEMLPISKQTRAELEASLVELEKIRAGNYTEADVLEWRLTARDLDLGPLEDARDMVMHPFSEAINVIKQALTPPPSWGQCVAQMKVLWNGYASKRYKVGSFIWIFDNDIEGYHHHVGEDTWQAKWNALMGTRLGEDMTLCVITADRGSHFELQFLDGNQQPITDTTYRGEWGEVHMEPGDSLPYLSQAIAHMPCVVQHVAHFVNQIRAAYNQIIRIASRPIRYVGSKLYAAFVDPQEGWVSLDFVVGLAYRYVLPHSVRHELGVSIVLWPSTHLGTVFWTHCTGKDSNAYSLDFAVGIGLGMDSDCFDGDSIAMGLAFQGAGIHGTGHLGVTANHEIGAEVSIAMQPPAGMLSGALGSPVPSLDTFEGQRFPELDGIAFSYGVAMKGNAPSGWNPFKDWVAGTIVHCRDREIVGRGSRNCPR